MVGTFMATLKRSALVLTSYFDNPQQEAQQINVAVLPIVFDLTSKISDLYNN